MKPSVMNKLRKIILVICCAVLTLLDSGAKAQSDGREVSSCAKSAILIERTTGTVLLSLDSR